EAARRATRTIPIVMVATDDPVATGLVASLARPGGNLTGVTLAAPGLARHRLELLNELAPGATRIAVLWNPTNPSNAAELQETEAAARARGLPLVAVPLSADSERRAALGAITSARAAAPPPRPPAGPARCPVTPRASEAAHPRRAPAARPPLQ